jgi:MerR family copper efflux transcriptional regulator
VQKIYMISDLASATGLSRHTLNFYLKLGLIKESGRTESNYRFFDQTVVDRLTCIIRLRQEGHPLTEIKARLEDGQP